MTLKEAIERVYIHIVDGRRRHSNLADNAWKHVTAPVMSGHAILQMPTVVALEAFRAQAVDLIKKEQHAAQDTADGIAILDAAVERTMDDLGKP